MMISVYTGYVLVDGVRIQVDFEIPSSASKQEVDSAFVNQLAKLVDLNYLVVGEYDPAKETANVSQA